LRKPTKKISVHSISRRGATVPWSWSKRPRSVRRLQKSASNLNWLIRKTYAVPATMLRARYPLESLDESLQRLQITGIRDTDAGNGLTLPRLNLLAATNQRTAISLGGSGPTSAVAGGNSTYTITVTNGGPLGATNVRLSDNLPPTAANISLPSGCVLDVRIRALAAISAP
jgi:uncharacterized repeat protein (TIGR01451 family)